MDITTSQPSSAVALRVGIDDAGLLFLRIVFGGLLTAAGLQKLFGWFGGQGLTATGALFADIGYRPGVFFAAVAGALEAIGGTLLLLGLFTPLASAIVIGVMINAAAVTWSGGLFGPTGYQMALLYATAAVTIACTGAGRLALDTGRAWHRQGTTWAAASIGLGVISAIGVLLLKTVL
jgi:putative oxidoreductase